MNKEESGVQVLRNETAVDLDEVAVKLTPFQFISVFVSFAFSVFLVSLDGTIVSTAIPSIGAEFRAFDQVSWIGIAFLLTSTALSPVYGELCNIFGRKPVFLFAIIIFEVGSLMCGIAPSMNFLIAGRAVAGIGGGGIFSCVLIMIADITSLRESGKYQGIIGAVFGLSSVIGPLLGGIFTDKLTWRWCFYINLPIGFIAALIVAVYLKFPPPEGSIKDKLHRLDYVGTFFIVVSTVLILIPLELGGSTWAWTDAKTISMLVVGGILAIVFVYVEARVSKYPIIPPRLFKDRSVSLAMLAAFFLGCCFIPLFFYVPTYFQLVNGETATSSGLESIPMIFGLVITSIVSGAMVGAQGRYQIWFVIGGTITCAGLALVSVLQPSTPKILEILILFVAGLGVGSVIQVRVYAVQAGVSKDDIASGTSASNFFLNLGGTFGLAIFGTVFNNALDSSLGSEIAAMAKASPKTISSMPNSDWIIQNVSNSLGKGYYFSIASAAAILIISAFIRDRRLSGEMTFEMQKVSDIESKPNPVDTVISEPAVKLTPVQFVSVFVSFAFSVFLVALDSTIVSTAIPSIGADFQAFDQVSWIGIAYLLTSTALSPVYGEFCNIFGRKPVFMFAIIIFEIGSLLCGIANSMNFLIAGRAIAGIGGGGIFSCVLIMISDITTLQESGKYQGLISAVFGLSSVIGPLLGGIFTDKLTWRWCFYINLPVGLIASIIVAMFLKFPPPEGSVSEKIHLLDFYGIFFVVASTVLILIPLELGGSTWEWSDPKTIICFVIGGILACVFVYVELKISKNPIIPPRLFTDRSVSLALMAAFFLGCCFIPLFFYVPTYFQMVNGESATTSGLESIPMILGLVITSIVSGATVGKSGNYQIWFLAGGVSSCVGLSLISIMQPSTAKILKILMLFLSGLGIGSLIQVRVYAVQAGVEREDIASGTSASNFFMNLGGTFALAIFGTVFNNDLDSSLGKKLAALAKASPKTIGTLPNSDFIVQKVSDSIGKGYYVSIGCAGAIVLLALFLKNRKLEGEMMASH
ncbi:hypothetical protein HDV06_006996 [Boothiomyces sp. JEL0866]|nr:hypothetical protein HDV06_006996 [Boothiomyces sp. JEL0866]